MGLIPCPNRVDVPADSHERIPLAASHKEVLKHLHKLWGFAVQLDQEDADGRVHPLAHCPELAPE